MTSEPLFVIEDHGSRLLVTFADRPGLGVARLDALLELRALFDDLARRSYPVVQVALPTHTLGDKLSRAVREAEAGLAHGGGEAPLLPLLREEHGFLELVRGVRRLPSLVVCTLAGEVDYAFLGLALACDYRIAAQNARFINHWLDAGEPPLGAAAWFLTRYLGVGRATTLLLDAPAITADYAKRLGLVQRCVPAAILKEASDETAARFARMPRGSLAAMKRALVTAAGDLEAYLELEERQLESALRADTRTALHA